MPNFDDYIYNDNKTDAATESSLLKEKQVSYGALAEEYRILWDTLNVRQSRIDEINAIVDQIHLHHPAYSAVSSATQVPWYVVAAIHYLQTGLDFSIHLHNGDPLSGYTVNEPAGRLKTHEPPFTWEESAVDALAYEGLASLSEWSIEKIAYHLEAFNGFGYRRNHPHVKSPYLWSFSNHYEKGCYIGASQWSEDTASDKCGAMVLLCQLIARRLVVSPPMDGDAPFANAVAAHEIAEDVVAVDPLPDETGVAVQDGVEQPEETEVNDIANTDSVSEAETETQLVAETYSTELHGTEEGHAQPLETGEQLQEHLPETTIDPSFQSASEAPVASADDTILPQEHVAYSDNDTADMTADTLVENSGYQPEPANEQPQDTGFVPQYEPAPFISHENTQPVVENYPEAVQFVSQTAEMATEAEQPVVDEHAFGTTVAPSFENETPLPDVGSDSTELQASTYEAPMQRVVIEPEYIQEQVPTYSTVGFTPVTDTTLETQPAPVIEEVVPTAIPVWFQTAIGETGTRDFPGPFYEPRVFNYLQTTLQNPNNDETTWSSAFVNWCMVTSGQTGTNDTNARTWLNYGDVLDTPKAGCIVIFWKGNPHSQTGHVGFFDGFDGNRIRILGAHPGGGVDWEEVFVASYPQERLLGYRWPREEQNIVEEKPAAHHQDYAEENQAF